MARLRERMSVDIPMAEIEFEQETWDGQRVLRQDQNSIKLGRMPYTAAAQHIESGALVAYTRLVTPVDKPGVAYQGDTLVHGDHRGHRLGLLVKLANLDAMVADDPEVRRIHTWNAGENEWMLAINTAMGFRRASTEGACQKKCTA